MEASKGIWTIRQGKGNRVYILSNESEHIMHPEQICDFNGLGIYGDEHLKDLATAIIKFYHKKEKKERKRRKKIKQATKSVLRAGLLIATASLLKSFDPPEKVPKKPVF